ncbi:hypothetical protein BU24DRAFT_86943 [Aaosphaeria arxii CBS 175.79]|uniref:F-box domain-containing protein n=1 Tax=Aaosphaeria arxii CBS 175.79 TaxID=1450172 RepID=A0A6A5X8S6_9PLEO|nr:uncharacterized protein BU24DRAFT_86943 [Aaosphaeria arxii CBS 175.79]KAF2009310.1 hypothetical protein BU24DRAFT_86943 [Aaosphaeria arxii CBS 175.79]
MEPPDSTTAFTSLPSELIHQILGYLPLSDLLSTGLVSRSLHEHSQQDSLYHCFVQENVPSRVLEKPPNSSWRELFKSHHPFWFIPRNKIWFSDHPHTGKLLVARYDHRIDAIEAYSIVAERKQPSVLAWDWNPEVIIHTFTPRIQLDLNVPVIRLDANAYQHAVGDQGYRLQKEIPMHLHGESPSSSTGLFSQLMLTRPWPKAITGASTPVWPPLSLPSSTRTRNDSASHFRDVQHRPSKLPEMSTDTFRLRRWMQFSPRLQSMGARMGEDITTWATLPEQYYRPTADKPWQGIWCGDYAGHGCEFLAIMQPDDPLPLPERAEWVMRLRERQGSVSSSDSWSTAPTNATSDDDADGDETMHESANGLETSVATLQAPDHEDSFHDPACVADDERIYRGRIEAVKLTGDPNIPRGEYTFIAPDISNNGLVRIATEELFKGARIVKSVGHIAARGFRDDDYIQSQLILISHDRLAQYWETFGHVSFYQRVNVDDFVKV